MADKKRSRRKWIIISVAVLVVLLILAIWRGRQDDSIKVQTGEANLRTITQTVSASGRIAPEVEVSISSAVSGEIVELPVKEGDPVEKGDLLVRINPDLALSALERAEAGLNNAKANAANARARKLQAEAQLKNARLTFQRSENLYEKGAISESEFQDAQASFETAEAEAQAARESVKAAEYSVSSARASVKEARDNYNRTTIFAPMDGTVSLLNVEVGEQVVGTAQMSGTEIMRVANLSVMQVEVDVNESDIVKVELNDTALIEVDAYLNRKFRGIVTEIASSAKNVSATSTDQVTNFLVTIRILRTSYEDVLAENSEMLSPFKPGMNANVEIQTETREEVVSVPIAAVTTRTDTSSNSSSAVQRFGLDDKKDGPDEPVECVFVYNSGKAELQPVEPGIQDSKYIEITQGLDSGQTVITGPYDVISTRLYNGDKVEKSKGGGRGNRREES